MLSMKLEESARINLINMPDEPAWGAGEPTICPVIPAVGNAIYDAAGVRLREYPYTPDAVLAALQGQR
jgi:CO/xanthine dehydrogenase Mo-binding subunit